VDQILDSSVYFFSKSVVFVFALHSILVQNNRLAQIPLLVFFLRDAKQQSSKAAKQNTNKSKIEIELDLDARRMVNGVLTGITILLCTSLVNKER